MALHVLTEADWPQLHRLMVARRFPNVPPTYQQARPHFAKATVLAAGRGDHLKAAFVFGPPEEGVAFFDVVCPTPQEGRWASKGLLQELFAHAFGPAPKAMALRALWVQPHGARALKAALAAGFQAVTPLGTSAAPIMVITPNLVPPSLQTQNQTLTTGEPTHGQPL